MATTKLDKFGRIVIPKAIRDRLGLEPGTELEMEEREDGVLIKPPDEEALLEMENGILVFTGELVGDVTDLVRKSREARTRHVMGLD
jgi:AbrB family looped-hinge helix DNA binding protein